jgi:dTDP-4-amino-4,6-dideoxygalactose transaminase
MNTFKIPFNKPYLSGKELTYIKEAVESGKISGDGIFTEKCHKYFEKRYGFDKVLLTTSCTAALEMAAILLDIKPGDEVIIPSYTFVSTANAFVLRGAKIIFADSGQRNPNLDPGRLARLVTPKTRAIVPVHYAGIACDMEAIMEVADRYQLIVVEDAAQAIDSFYKDRPLGTIGHLATFSFHETKNIISGEGGMLAINEPSFNKRAEIIWEKGTNRSAFFRGEVDKYGWVDIGSSFLPSEVIAAFLYAQLENLDNIQKKRKQIWDAYYQGLQSLEEKGYIQLPDLPVYATCNGHLFYLVCRSLEERTALIRAFRNEGILAVFHYLSLHSSPYYREKHDGRILPNADRYTECLLRLPLFYELKDIELQEIITKIIDYYK